MLLYHIPLKRETRTKAQAKNVREEKAGLSTCKYTTTTPGLYEWWRGLKKRRGDRLTYSSRFIQARRRQRSEKKDDIPSHICHR